MISLFLLDSTSHLGSDCDPLPGPIMLLLPDVNPASDTAALTTPVLYTPSSSFMLPWFGISANDATQLSAPGNGSEELTLMTRVWFPLAWQWWITSYSLGPYDGQNKEEERRKAVESKLLLMWLSISVSDKWQVHTNICWWDGWGGGGWLAGWMEGCTKQSEK